ncbi:MAG: hypothetical protein AAFV98_19765 [Chloroflexota bacterium]
MNEKPSAVAHMMSYGAIYGVILGVLFGLSVVVWQSMMLNTYDVLIGTLSAFIWGTFLGGIYGSIAGFLSGMWITLVNALVDYQKRPQLHKWVSFTLIVLQAIVFVPRQFNVSAMVDVSIMLYLALPIATVAMLYLAHRYHLQLRDFYTVQDPRKEKPKRKMKNDRLALADEVSQSEMYEATICEQEVRKL